MLPGHDRQALTETGAYPQGKTSATALVVALLSSIKLHYNCLYVVVISGKKYRSIRSKTNKLKNSFFPQTVKCSNEELLCVSLFLKQQ